MLTAWIATNVIRERVAERARKKLAKPPTALTQHDAEDLAADTIARVLEKFRVDVLGAGTWNPKKGASLKTFWIGYCVLKYPDLYDRWCTQQRHWIQGLELAEHDADRPPDLCYQDPARQHDLADVVNEALRSVGSNATAKVLVLQEAGYSHAEIAELLDTTVKAIESRIHRHRKTTNAA